MMETGKVNDEQSTIECAVCLQVCIHPVKLPCSHIFCFLCVKGVVNQGRKCAMCRRDIPADYLDNPLLLENEDRQVFCAFEDGYQWFYEGRNGWWLYDERTSVELEQAFKSGESTCELLIAGFLYTIDFSNMLQLRKNDPSKKRRIKRDLATEPKKGVAGIRIENSVCEITSSVDGRSQCQERKGAYGEDEHAHDSSLDLSPPNSNPCSYFLRGIVHQSSRNDTNETIEVLESNISDYSLNQSSSSSSLFTNPSCQTIPHSVSDETFNSNRLNHSSYSFQTSASDENFHDISSEHYGRGILSTSYSDSEVTRRNSNWQTENLSSGSSTSYHETDL